jgi:hypothetical protein
MKEHEEHLAGTTIFIICMLLVMVVFAWAVTHWAG